MDCCSNSDKTHAVREKVRKGYAAIATTGGRVAVSDLALLKPLPRKVLESIEALIGCVAGAVLVNETRKMSMAAGLIDITLTPKAGYLDNMADWNDPLYRGIVKSLPKGAKIGDYVTSLNVVVRKPEPRRKR